MSKKSNILSLISNAIIFISTTICVLVGAFLGIDGNMVGAGSEILIYFTVQSNIFVALISFIYLFFNIKKLLNENYEIPSIVKILKYVSSVSVMLTFTTVVLFLDFVYGSLIALLKGINFFLHFLTPILAFVSSCFFEKNKISKKIEWLAIIPTCTYSIVYFLNVIVFQNWIDFYYFTFGGKYFMIPISAIVMYGISYLLGLLLSRITNKINK